jgi:sensor histidine kinase YesM
LKDNKLQYTITDNGVGRSKSEAYNKHNKPYHKSVGLKITDDRIKIFNNSQISTVQITDELDSEDQVAGTKVVVTLNIN